jgi:hypothetical protein
MVQIHKLLSHNAASRFHCVAHVSSKIQIHGCLLSRLLFLLSCSVKGSTLFIL